MYLSNLIHFEGVIKIILKKPDFNTIVNDFCANIRAIEEIYVVFKAAYREIDLSSEKYMIVRLEFEYDLASYVWNWDWDEGHEYIDLFGIYTESDILNLILAGHTEGKNED